MEKMEKMALPFVGQGVEVTRVATSQPRISELRIRVTDVSDGAAMEEAMRAIRSFFETVTGRVVTRAIVACNTTPGPSQLTSFVRHLTDLQTLMDAKLKGTIVQVDTQSISTNLAMKVFDKAYTPSEGAKRRVFEIVYSESDFRGVMDGILKHEEEKQARRKK